MTTWTERTWVTTDWEARQDPEFLLMETWDFLLLETWDKILLEGSYDIETSWTPRPIIS